MARGKKTGGRRKGSLNRKTVEVKAALVEAFAGIGGVPALKQWGEKNRTEFYKLWGRLIPQEIKADVDGSVRMQIVEELTDAPTESVIHERNGVHGVGLNGR